MVLDPVFEGELVNFPPDCLCGWCCRPVSGHTVSSREYSHKKTRNFVYDCHGIVDGPLLLEQPRSPR
jgi:hypothetical protein